MAIEVIEGDLEAIKPVKVKFGYSQFVDLAITTTDGQARRFARVATGEPVTSQVVAGGRGRFYFDTFGGAVGLVGIKRPDGGRYFGKYSNLPIVTLVVGALGLFLAVARFFFGADEVPMLSAIFGPIAFVCALVFIQNDKASRRFFDADEVRSP